MRDSEDVPSSSSNPQLFSEQDRATLDVLSDSKLSVQERLQEADRRDASSSNGAQLQQQQLQEDNSNVPFPIW